MIDCIIGFKGAYFAEGDYISLDCKLSEHLQLNVEKVNDRAIKKVRISLQNEILNTTTYEPAYRVIKSGWYIIDYVLLPFDNALMNSSIYLKIQDCGLYETMKSNMPKIFNYFKRHKHSKCAYIALAFKSDTIVNAVCSEPISEHSVELLGKFDFGSQEIVPYEEPIDWCNDPEEILIKIENKEYDPAIIFAESKEYAGQSAIRLVDALSQYIEDRRFSNDTITFGAAIRKYAMNAPTNSLYFNRYAEWLTVRSRAMNPEIEMELVKGFMYRLQFGSDNANVDKITKNYELMKEAYYKIGSVLSEIVALYSSPRILLNPIYANTYLMAINSLCIMKAIENVANSESPLVKSAYHFCFTRDIIASDEIKDELDLVINDMRLGNAHESLLSALIHIKDEL